MIGLFLFGGGGTEDTCGNEFSPPVTWVPSDLTQVIELESKYL